MTKREAEREWRGHYLPQVRAHYEQDGRADYPARSESWGSYADSLCKAGQITDAQYHNWHAPRECGP